jgi:hypothetical protein
MSKLAPLLTLALCLTQVALAAPPPGAPEIDPGSCMAPLSLGIATFYLLKDRRKRS